MSDSVTINHAARIIGSVSPEQRADSALRFYFEAHRYISPREKRDISHAVFVYFRWFSWLDAKASIQKRVEYAEDLHDRFSKDPKSIKPEALAVRALPEWVAAEMDVPADYLRQIQRDPALWLRARPGKAGSLAAALQTCETTPRSTDALRYFGTKDLFKTNEFQGGEFEIQDLASQLVGLAASPNPGETWWDCCAGEGGKTLHLADLMSNKGLIWATDRSARRIDTLKRRAARAKLFNYRTAFWDGGSKLPTKGKFDGILLDAPCSGIGTWQRNPHARWTTTMDDVRELAGIQRTLLENVSGSLKPNGRLIYAVCTLARSETTAVADAFTAAHPELEPMPVLGAGPQVTLWPQDLNANGMFIAGWKKKK